MKKLVLSMVAAAAVLVAVPVATMQANAAEKNTIFLEESFKDDFFSKKKWTVTETTEKSIDVSSSIETGHMFFQHPAGLEQFQVGTAKKIQNMSALQFDYLADTSQWIELNFEGSNNVTNSNTFAMAYQGEVAICAKSSSVSSRSPDVSLPAKVFVQENEWYTIRLDVTSAMSGKLSWAKQGSTDFTELTTLNVSSSAAYTLHDLYIFWGAEGGGKLALDNIIVEYPDGTMEKENFNDEEDITLVKGYTTAGLKWKINKADSYLAATALKAGDNLMYREQIPVETSVLQDLECLKVQFEATMKNGAGDTMAFVFGASDDKNLEAGCYRLVMDASVTAEESIWLEYYENGTSTRLMEKVDALKLATADGAKIGIVVNKIGKVTISLDGEDVGVATIDKADFYAGSFGFVATKDNTGTTRIDNLNIIKVDYKVPVTKSVTHNFSNDFFGNEGFEDFLVNPNPENALYVKDGKLVWDTASDHTYFGSAHEYDDFVLDFKISSIKTTQEANSKEGTAPDKWLGVDLGKAVKGEKEYGSNVMLGFHITPTAETVSVWAYCNATSNVNKQELTENMVEHKQIPASLFRAIQYDNVEKRETDVQEGDAVCVRFVAENNTVRVYMKKASEVKYTLYYTYNGIETTGYTALCCTGWTHMKLDDFSMANTSSVYICADSYEPETIVTPGKEVIIYDRGNVDMNGLKEAQANADSGCGSSVSAAFAIVPLAAAALVVMNKRRKD